MQKNTIMEGAAMMVASFIGMFDAAEVAGIARSGKSIVGAFEFQMRRTGMMRYMPQVRTHISEFNEGDVKQFAEQIFASLPTAHRVLLEYNYGWVELQASAIWRRLVTLAG